MEDYQPTKTTVYKFFKSEELFVIPRFQRSFAWKDQDVEEFYSDFIQTSTDNISFLGNIVIDASSPNEYQIIDGQQRIMVVTILAAAIRDTLIEDVATDDAKKLANTINLQYIQIDPLARGENPYRVKPSRDLEDFFALFIQRGEIADRTQANTLIKSGKQDEPKRLVKKAYELFRKKIYEDKLGKGSIITRDSSGSVEILKNTITKLTDISFIEIKIFNNDMAYAIFESHNAKGVDLAVSDLVKNYYFGKLKGPEDYKERQMAKWDELVLQVQETAGSTIDRFLHYYLQSYVGKFPKSQLYRRVKQKIDQDTAEFEKELAANIKVYLELKTATLDGQLSNKQNNALESINSFNVEQCYILLLSLFRNRSKFNPKTLLMYVNLIENFTFIYSKISQMQANEVEKIYANLASEIEGASAPKDKNMDAFSGQQFSKLSKALNALLPGYEIFERNFVNLDYNKPAQKKLINYIFRKYEDFSTKGGMSLGLDIHLDHIFPQNPPKNIERPKSLHKIGNLVALDMASGAKAGNKLPSDKVQIYAESSSEVVRSLIHDLESNACVVDEEFIINRSKSLALDGYEKVWHIS